MMCTAMSWALLFVLLLSSGLSERLSGILIVDTIQSELELFTPRVGSVPIPIALPSPQSPCTGAYVSEAGRVTILDNYGRTFYIDLCKKQITEGPRMIVQRWWMPSAVTGDDHTHVMVCGGRERNSGVKAQLEVLSSCETLGGQWHTLDTPLITPRAYHTMTRLQNGSVLAIGGEKEGEVLKSVEMWEGRWIKTTPLDTPRFRHAAALTPSEQLLVCGGLTEGHWYKKKGHLQSCEVLGAKDKWQPAPHLRLGREQFAMVQHQGRVYAIGGNGSTPNSTMQGRSIEWLYERAKQWMLVKNALLKNRHGHCAVSVDVQC